MFGRLTRLQRTAPLARFMSSSSGLGSGRAADITCGSEIPCVDLLDFYKGGQPRAQFVKTAGESLSKYGSFAVRNHGIDVALKDTCLSKAGELFALPQADKDAYIMENSMGQRGYTKFGTEAAKGSKHKDLKEMWQIGRTNVTSDHVIHSSAQYGPNVWPGSHQVDGFRDAYTALYYRLEAVALAALSACAQHAGAPEHIFADAALESDSLLRLIHYPPVDPSMPREAVRAAAHEDINFITLLLAANEPGLEILGKGNKWIPISSEYEEIEVHCGDMLQNITNGLFQSTTHRVVNPDTSKNVSRYSVPFFVHPRPDFDLTPLPSCVEKTGGEVKYPSITSGAFLKQRLEEIMRYDEAE